MDDLPEDTRREIIKMSSERIHLRLVREGYDKVQIFALDRDDLLDTLARHILYPPAKHEEEVRGAVGEVEHAEETIEADKDVRMMELRIRERELADREEEREFQKQQLQLDMLKEKPKRKKDEDERERLAREEQRQMKKDEEETARKESLPEQLCYFGKMVEHLLPKMGDEPAEYPEYFESVQDIFRTTQVPKNIQAILVLPKLNDRSRSLLTKIPKQHLNDYVQMKDYLLREFKLTAQQYRDSFWSATKCPEESYKLFGGRVKTLFQ